MKGEFFKA